ncbi:hypothetical protein Ndes2437B_g00665 [Nannochloris sp. 'desiccata']
MFTTPPSWGLRGSVFHTLRYHHRLRGGASPGAFHILRPKHWAGAPPLLFHNVRIKTRLRSRRKLCSSSRSTRPVSRAAFLLLLLISGVEPNPGPTPSPTFHVGAKLDFFQQENVEWVPVEVIRFDDSAGRPLYDVRFVSASAAAANGVARGVPREFLRTRQEDYLWEDVARMKSPS